MEEASWRPAAQWVPPGAASAEDVSSPDWRTQVQPDARQRIVNKIMETLKKHLPMSVPKGINELKKIAVRYEEKIYTKATSQPDYVHRISMKMLMVENKAQAKTQASGPTTPPIADSVPGGQNPADSGVVASIVRMILRRKQQDFAEPTSSNPPTRSDGYF